VGFAVYKANTCLPGNAEISTKFSPIEIFGSSFHPCVDAGDYLVQVSSNNNANGPIFLTLDLSDTTGALYDKPADAQVFTNININQHTVHDYLVQCQTIDNAAENCLPNGSFKDFTKSTWHTFTTPGYFSWFSVMLADIQGNPAGARYTVGYRIYEGDSRTTPVASLILQGGCDSLRPQGYYYDYKMYRCGELKPNTTYTVQLLYHKDFNKTMRLAVTWDGAMDTKAPQPLASIPSPNNMGILPANSTSGITTNLIDYFGCNSQHSLYTCSKSMPVNGVVRNGYGYKLSTFFSFKLATSTTATFYAAGGCGGYLMRLYKQSLTNNCSDLDTSNLLSTFLSTQTFQCLDSGQYVLQVMGRDTIGKNDSYHFGNFGTGTGGICLSTLDLGRIINLQIYAKTEVATNKFSLSAPGRFEKINVNGAGVMQPLQIGVTYTAQPDTLGCANTVLPDNDICQPGTSDIFTKVTYREFTLSDSVIMIVPGYISSAKASKIFKGDANALATSQAAFSYPQKITGLQPYSGCFSGYSNTQNACLTPGTYTLANFDNRLGYEVTSKFTISQPVTKYNSAAKAQDMGDIWLAIDPNYSLVMSAVDTFTCHDNPMVIDGVNPCTGTWSVPASKQIYRQFYLSKPALVSIFSSYGYPYYRNFAGVNTLFSGKATDGILQLRSMSAKWTCTASMSSGQCDVLPAGWYTVVSYGVGPTYSNPLPGNPYNAQYSDLGLENGIFIRLSAACPTPKFNRPHKASIDTLTGQPYKIQWGPQTGHTAAYPVTSKKYTLNVENFDCSQDTAFINTYMQRCAPENVKVSFFVFQLTQESYVQIGSMPYDFVASVYDFDVRGADSSRLKTDSPLQTCLTNSKVIEFCKLQPGLYTLVIYGSDVYSSSCITITPTIYVDQVGTSRFDHAANAYDFGAIIPDSTWRDRKPGDVNPLDANRAPGNDFFYCTTGAQPLDPDLAACMSKYNPNIYKAGNNITLHPTNATAPDNYTIDRRNLWYTFTVEHAGKVRVRVRNKTLNKIYQQPFAIYKSDVNGTLPFSQVVASGAVDSTLAQGLVYVTRNHAGGVAYQFCQGPEEIEFFIPPCLFTPTRYYVMVENRNPYNYGEVQAMNPNSQVEVSVLFDSVSARPPKFDHFSQANDMGLVNSGIKKGDTDNFTCATKDLPDPINYTYVSNCNKTLWYKFTTTTTGQIRYATFFKNTNNYYYDHAQLFKQVLPNDSSSTGLKHLLYTSTYNNNGNWAQRCIDPGTYYLLLPGCNALDEDVYPQIEIIEQAGDFCSAPMVTGLTGPGTRVVPVTIDCHTIGTDYGEFNPTLTCPANATTNNYKTSWYRLDITGTDTLDVTVYINENTNATSTDIKYRMMTGTCGAMQEQSCVQDALTRNTYKCLAPGNSYYIQVFTPNIYNGQPVTSTIDLNLAAVVHADSCFPANNCIGVANFTPKFDCTKDKNALFTNFSTYGSSISYDWDFGYNSQKSNAVSPSFFYPALTTSQIYSVKLVIINNTPGCNKKDSVTQTITIPARPAVNLGADTSNCINGKIVLLDATSHPGATYAWYNGSTQPTFTASGVSSPWVEVTYNGCKTRDTINVWINPVAKKTLQTLALCNVTTIALNANRGQGEQYTWNTGASTSSITVAQPGYYWADVYLNGCTIRDSFLVVSTDLRPLGNDTIVCQRNMPFTANATVSGATSYKWQNNTTSPTLNITQPGLYWVDISLGACTFRDTLKLAVDSFKNVSLTAKICNGQVYTMPSGRQVGASGVYQDSLRNARGCDSIITTVTLSVNAVFKINTAAAVCAGQNYTLPSGVVVNLPGTYSDTVRYASGCDSLISTITLSVKPLVRTSNAVTICEGQSYTLPSGLIVTTAGSYNDTVRYSTGCDSLISVTNMTVKPLVRTTTSASVCRGLTYTLPSGAIVSNAGTYSDTIRYVAGCDSLITTVSLSVKALTRTSSNAAVCAGQSYTLPSGAIVNTTGTYIDTVKYTSGCDSLISTINLVVKTLTRTSTATTICQNQAYTFPSGKIVSASGTYNDTLRYTIGCDSVITTINLTVMPVTNRTTNPFICQNQTYTLPSGIVVNVAGTYRDTIRYLGGCDSLITLTTLQVINAIRTASSVAICAGQTYTLPSGKVVSITGNYVDTVKTQSGCDSLISTIDLTVKALTRVTVNPVICANLSYTSPSGVAYTSTGVYSDTLRYSGGCDSLITSINLTVKPVTRNTLAPSICEGRSYTLPSGIVVNTAGTYIDTLRYNGGCDSVINTINLSVQPLIRASSTTSICAGQNYILPSGKTVNAAGTYVDTVKYNSGCDSLISTITITQRTAIRVSASPVVCEGQGYTFPSGSTINTTGIYADTIRYTSGCDSLITTVNLLVKPVKRSTLSAAICQGQTYTLPSGKTVSTTAIYNDTIRYGMGCDSLITTVNLFVYAPTLVTTNASICVGQTYTLPSGSIVSTAGNYVDIMKNQLGCDSIINTIKLTVYPNPVVSLSKSNDINCVTGSAALTASGGLKYAWSPIVGLSNPFIYNPVASPSLATMYTAQVTTARGCTSTDSIQVNVNIGDAEGGYLLPSAFTPNGDNKNDCFGVKTWGWLKDLQFTVFDRWGTTIFATTDPSKCWDGTFNGSPQGTGAYVYSITATTICGPIVRKGTIVLIR
jgi:gliding motility-associated-like protein